MELVGPTRVERRLAAILAVDVVSYSRLIEAGIFGRLKALRAELIARPISARRGRIVKTVGDGMMVEFGGTVDAVRCAVEVQQAMRERNPSVGADNRIDLRIGINLGDVIVEATTSMATASTAPHGRSLCRSRRSVRFNTGHDHVRDWLKPPRNCRPFAGTDWRAAARRSKRTRPDGRTGFRSGGDARA